MNVNVLHLLKMDFVEVSKDICRTWKYTYIYIHIHLGFEAQICWGLFNVGRVGILPMNMVQHQHPKLHGYFPLVG